MDALCPNGECEQHGDLDGHALVPTNHHHDGPGELTYLVLEHRRERARLTPQAKLMLQSATIPAQQLRRRRLRASYDRELEQQLVGAAHQLMLAKMVKIVLQRCMSRPGDC